MSEGTPRILSEMVDRLAIVRQKENNSSLLYGILFSASAIVGAAMLALLIEQMFYLPVLPRTIIFWLIVAAAVGLFAWFVVRPLLKKESDEQTAEMVGSHFPYIKDKLVNILQLDKEKSSQLYSPELIDASFEDVRKEIEPLDFASVVSFVRARRVGKILGVVAGVAALLLLTFPSLRDSAGRLWHYNQSFAAPLPFRFIVEPGNKEVVKGAAVPITIRVEGEPAYASASAGRPPKQITLSSKPSGQIQFEERTLTANANGVFSYEMPALKSTTTYKAHSGLVSSDEYMLTVLDRPIVKMLRLSLSFPSYSKLPSRQLDDNAGDVTALRGTRINFSIESNKELAEAELIFGDPPAPRVEPSTEAGAKAGSTSTQLKIEENKAAGALSLVKERTYHIQLKDKENVASADPIEYTLKIVPDAYPTAQILFPGTNVDIAENQKLNMLYKITDDFGFSKLRLAYKLIQSRYEQPWQEEKFTLVPIPAGIRNESDVAHLWSLQEMNLVPEDVVSYYIEVFDNDNVSGPKSARSEVYTLRLPSLEEVFADVDKSHEMSIEGMKEALKQSEEAKKELDELQQEMKKQAQQKMDWQQQKKAEEAMKKYDEVQKKMEEVNKALDEMVKKLEKTETLSKETMDKYQELQQLMSEMNSPEFAEAMKKMQEAMMQMNPEQMKQAMQQFKFSEENFRNSIERTMNLLKRIQIEQKVDEMVKRTEEMMKKQEELQKQTEQTNPSSVRSPSDDKNKLNDLAQQQKDLKEQLEQLQKELAELQKKMQEFPTEMPLSEMQKAREQLEQSQLDEQMEQIAQQMQQQQVQQAQQNQQSARQKMQQFMQSMQQMQQAMRQNQQRQIVNEMRRAMQDILALSKRQEELKNQSQRLDANSSATGGFRENAQAQMEIMRDLANVTEGLSKLSQKTFAISPEMGKSIGDAMRQMNSAMQSLEQRSGQQAGGQQQGAMGSLNEAASQLQSAMQGMMQGGQGQGMGMGGFMQRLQQMSGQQQGINQGTQNLGGMTPQQQAEMGRLAAEQGMVRKSLEQLAKEAAQGGELSKMLGDLNRVAQDMREVQTDLAQGNVNPETIRKQERILSRLLDSQRSARERDFEKKRKAGTGTNVARKSPGEIDLSTQEGRNRLRQDLQKAIEEGYAKDYQELIKKYYEALEKLEKEN